MLMSGFVRFCNYFLVMLFVLLSSKDLVEKGETYRGLANAWNIVPSRSLAGLHYLFKGFQIKEDVGLVRVTGPVVQITDGQKWGSKVYPDGYSSEIDEDEFEDEQILGNSVFETTSRTGSNVGTAFLVGSDVVFTNRHVMSYQPGDRKWECGLFSIKLNHRPERVECEKVLYCSSHFDYCVVLMKTLPEGTSLSTEVKPLRLTKTVRAHPDANLLHIGNAAGLGIQASRGRGLKLKDGEFYHYAPTLGGSSGAPLFNDKNQVIGLNWGLTGGPVIDDQAFNRGVLASTIYEELRRQSPSTLKKVKTFRTWYHLSSVPRQSKIER
jgi:hypothetical protein